MLTDKALKALKPRSIIYEVPDAQGLSVRVSTAGTLTFQYRYRVNGRPERYMHGHYPDMSLAEARDAHKVARRLVDQGLSPIRHRREQQAAEERVRLEGAGADTVKCLSDEWMNRYVEKERKRPENARQMLDADVIPTLGTMKARDVKRKDIIAMLDKIVDRGAPVQANRTAAIVKQMFQFGVERGVIDLNPAADIRRQAVGGTERSRERNLNPDEIGQLWNRIDRVGDVDPKTGKKTVQIGKSMAVAIKLLLVTAQRRGELVKAKKDDVDLIAGIWTIPAGNAKNGRAHQVPLPPLAINLFTTLVEFAGDSAYVMRSASGKTHITERALTKAAERAQTLIGIEKWVPHDLRRTASTQLAQLGVMPQVVEKILNHTMQGVMAAYNKHDYMAERKDALHRWAERILSLSESDRIKTVVSARARKQPV